MYGCLLFQDKKPSINLELGDNPLAFSVLILYRIPINLLNSFITDFNKGYVFNQALLLSDQRINPVHEKS